MHLHIYSSVGVLLLFTIKWYIAWFKKNVDLWCQRWCNQLYKRVILKLINIYFARVALLAQLLLIGGSKSLFINTNILLGASILLILKLISSRNHFLNYLITVEVFIVIVYRNILYEVRYLSSSRALLFLLIVVMVGGACVGISLLVVVTRIINKELELCLTTI